MRLPNNYGSVSKLSGNRRKPYIVRKTKGWNENGQAIADIIGYYSTREEALKALADYNQNPYDVDKAKMTFKNLYELWLNKKATKLGQANLKQLKCAIKHCRILYTMKYREIKAYHMQGCIDNCGHGYSTQGTIKNLLKRLDKFALELDIVNKCYSDLITSASIPATSKRPFTEEEIEKLWEMKKEPWVDSVLIFLYTGFRISELLSLKISDIDLQNMIIKGGTKTDAGKNRIVPIHSRILPFVKARVNNNDVYLFGTMGSLTYYKIWNEIMQQAEMAHTPHECRHTFRSRLDSAGANKVCIDLLMGHKSTDVGERIYTHKTIEELRATIMLLK
jgi:integrase